MKYVQLFILKDKMMVEKNCCTNCFWESEIKKFIEYFGIIGDCDYCGSQSVNICDVSNAGMFIMEGIERHYEDAAMEVGYSSSEGGYSLPTQQLDDILLNSEAIFGDKLDDPYPLLNDLVSNDGTPYVRIDPYGPPSGDPDEIEDWSNFCRIIKNKQRFTIFLSSVEDNQYGHRHPKDLLFYLAHNYMPFLITFLQPQNRIYRARINNENKKMEHKELTSPPPERSRNNRMSPAGISYFYGGLTPEVCINELYPSIVENVTVAEFEVISDLLVLDLSKEPEKRRSIFDPEYIFVYEEYSKAFLEHFVKDISKPIRAKDSEIEYSPTQVFTEFVKSFNFKESFYLPGTDGNESDVFLDGIIFKSSVMKDGVNVVLFRGPEISTVDIADPKGALLFYKGNKTYQVTKIAIESMIRKDE